MALAKTIKHILKWVLIISQNQGTQKTIGNPHETPS